MSDVPGIFSKFIVYAKATGAAYPGSDQLPLNEATTRDHSLTRFLVRGRDRNAITGPADGFKTKIKWRVEPGYGKQDPGTPVEWKRRGSLEFLSTNYCRELGTVQLIRSEVKKQIGSVWGPRQMAQRFDDVLQNYMQDLYIDCSQVIEGTLLRVPNPNMEIGDANEPRCLFMGMNEWKQAHGVAADGALPGITQIENYSVTAAPNGKMAAETVAYSAVGPTTEANQQDHLFRALSLGLRLVNYRALPLAEEFTQDTSPFREWYASIEGCMLIQSTLAAHDSVIAESGVDNVFTMTTRFKNREVIDVPELEDLALCPDYDAQGDPGSLAAALYDASADEQVYYTELNSPNAKGPRFYVPYHDHCRPIWDEDDFMRKSPLYELSETVPDAWVCTLENFRNLHFESFRRNLVVHPNADITGY